MDKLGRVLGRLRCRESTRTATALRRPVAAIPPAIASRLGPDNLDDPLFPKAKRFGRGVPGVTQEDEVWWVIRDERGRVVGGAMVDSMGPDHPVSIDVAVDPSRQGRGFGTALYAALAQAGIDVEAASAASLAHRTMTPLGYVFMRSRRRRTDPDAEHRIVETAAVCPGCGTLDR